MGKVIDFAKKRLAEETSIEGSKDYNEGYVRYWAAYLDGARAQKREDENETQKPNGNKP